MPTVRRSQFGRPVAAPTPSGAGERALAQAAAQEGQAVQQFGEGLSDLAIQAFQREQTTEFIEAKQAIDNELAEAANQMQLSQGAAVDPAAIGEMAAQRYQQLRQTFADRGRNHGARLAEREGITQAGRLTQSMMGFKAGRQMANLRTATANLIDTSATSARTGTPLGTALDEFDLLSDELATGLSEDHEVRRALAKGRDDIVVGYADSVYDLDGIISNPSPQNIEAKRAQVQGLIDDLQSDEGEASKELSNPGTRDRLIDEGTAVLGRLNSIQGTQTRKDNAAIRGALQDRNAAIGEGNIITDDRLTSPETLAWANASAENMQLYRKSLIYENQKALINSLVSGGFAESNTAFSVIENTVSGLEGSDDFRAYQSFKNDMTNLKNDREKELRNNAAEYVRKNDGPTKAALDQYNAVLSSSEATPDDRLAAWQNYVNTSLSAQDRMGAAQAFILDKRAMDQIANTLSNPANSGQEKADTLATLNAQITDEYWSLVVNQLERDPNVPRGYAILADTLPFSPQAVSDAAVALDEFEDNQKAAKDGRTDIDSSVNSILTEYSASIANLPGSAKVREDMRHVLTAMATKNWINGQSGEDAVEVAYKRIVSDHFNFVPTGENSIMIPKVFDADLMENSLRDIKRGIIEQNRGEFAYVNDENLSQDEANRMFEDGLEDTGRWVAHPQGGAILTDQFGNVVRTRSGQNFIMSFDTVYGTAVDMEIERRQQRIEDTPQVSPEAAANWARQVQDLEAFKRKHGRF